MNEAFMIALLLVLLVLAIICVVRLLKRNKKDREQFQRERQQDQYHFQQEQQQFQQERASFQSFKEDVDRQEAVKKEKAKRRYVTPKLKERVLERDRETCQICGISKQYFDKFAPGLGDYLLLEVDHVVSVKAGGRGDDIDNLQVLCWRCNRKKSGTRTNADVASMIDYGISVLPKHDSVFDFSTIQPDK